MEKVTKVKHGSSSKAEETEGARRATGVSSATADEKKSAQLPPNPEVLPKAKRRRFTAAYKLRILQETDSCTDHGQIGQILRREGLYASQLSKWRRQRQEGTLKSLSHNTRGRKPKAESHLANRIDELEKENEELRKKLKQAEAVIGVQKKISELFGITAESFPMNESI